MNSRFMLTDDEADPLLVGGNPCGITNLAQPFYVTSITQSGNRTTTITWQSCQFFRYLVFSANVMSTNMQWVPQAYVWGSNGASVTSWTDMSTTNNDGNTATQRFYRVQRLLSPPITAGSDFSVVLTQDGKLWAWGDNGGELGDGLGGVVANGNTVEAYLTYPGEVANVIPCTGQAITNAAAVAAGGDDFTVVVDAGGTVWTFGEGEAAQLGNGLGPCYDDCPPNITTAVPVPITGVSKVVAVAAGHQHALALRSDGKVFAWGNNSQGDAQYCSSSFAGELGIGALPANCSYATNIPVACQFPSNVMIVAVAAGGYHSVALDTNGNVWTFGYNSAGQLGNSLDGSSSSTNVPTMLTTISNVIAIAAGESHTVALRADKTLWAWGDDNYYELGRDPSGSSGDDPLPGEVVADGLSNNVVAIAAGNGFTLAVTTNGQVYAFGDNFYDELGTDGPSELETPTPVAGISNAVWVSAPRSNDGRTGGRHTLVMTLDQGTSHYWGFGDNTVGEVGAGAGPLSDELLGVRGGRHADNGAILYSLPAHCPVGNRWHLHRSVQWHTVSLLQHGQPQLHR
jgi:alpha-tubulin suppressor-like RCC1 family protein